MTLKGWPFNNIFTDSLAIPLDQFSRILQGGLKALQMGTMITKWYFGKFERTHHPYPT